MKKIFLLITISLLLGGCFHDPKETALENCANSRVMDKYYSINKDLSKNSTLIQKINKKLDKSIAVSNIKSSTNLKAESKKTMLEFAKSNFNLNEDEIYTILNTSYINKKGFSDEVMTFLGKPHDPEKVINKIKDTLKQKGQSHSKIAPELFKEILQEYNTHRQILRLHIKFKEKMITKTFLEMKMKDKFLEERYQKFYQRCERIYNELPSSFINKWEHNTELKEFLDKT